MQGIYGHPRYVLKRQFAKLVGASFRIYDPAGNLVLFVEKKGFKLKAEIRVFSDESKSTQLLEIRARQIIDFSAAYDVIDSQTGTKLGALQRKGWASMVRDEWIIMGPEDRQIGTVIEDSMLFSMMRRLLTTLIPQNYDVLVGGVRHADLKQKFNPFVYHMDIDFSMDPQGTLDRRIGIVAAVLLAAIEGRQGGGV